MYSYPRSRFVNAPVFLMAVMAFCLLAVTPALAKKSNTKRLTDTQKKEISIMEKIADQHQKALEVAMVGNLKTTDTAIKTFCDAYATRLQTEITQLHDWLLAWYQIDYTPKAGDGIESDLLEPYGIWFTDELVGALIGAHNANIAQEKQALKREYHAELKTFATTAIATDQTEVVKLKTWQKKYDTLVAKTKKNPTNGKKNLSQTQKKEIQIMKKIMDQHQKALEVALVGDLKTTDTAVKAFCNTYAARMQSEITQIQVWLSTWYQIAYAPQAGSGFDDDLLKLEGDEFTAELIDMLIGVHNANIAQEKQALKREYHAELKTLATNAIKTDGTELGQLKIWEAQYNPDLED